MTEQIALALATREVVLAQARTLARQGRYGEAEQILRDLEPDVLVLDLLARIHAQQGRLGQADQCWAAAERLAPDIREIAEGRRRVASMRGGARRRRGRLVYRAGATAGLALTFALLVDTRVELGRLPTAPYVQPSHAPAQTMRPTAADLAGMDLRLSGVRARRRSGEITVTFTEGLFRDGVTLSSGGRTVLDALGARLRPYATRISVAVIGHTDDLTAAVGGDYADNLELGTLRATVVREVLRSAAGIPTTRFSVSSLGDVMPPFRGHGTADRARNRTVSLRISAAGEG
ncbi:OmpA family protein [Actinoallomurus sp. CA-150999]|uniref:OmpA/MotB family protein n=1 Tax=Actinoallomurus sp. CA-150999 TaxID=3239887 RepID=UPI003D8C28A8